MLSDSYNGGYGCSVLSVDIESVTGPTVALTYRSKYLAPIGEDLRKTTDPPA